MLTEDDLKEMTKAIDLRCNLNRSDALRLIAEVRQLNRWIVVAYGAAPDAGRLVPDTDKALTFEEMAARFQAMQAAAAACI